MCLAAGLEIVPGEMVSDETGEEETLAGVVGEAVAPAAIFILRYAYFLA